MLINKILDLINFTDDESKNPAVSIFLELSPESVGLGVSTGISTTTDFFVDSLREG